MASVIEAKKKEEEEKESSERRRNKWFFYKRWTSIAKEHSCHLTLKQIQNNCQWIAYTVCAHIKRVVKKRCVRITKLNLNISSCSYSVQIKSERRQEKKNTGDSREAHKRRELHSIFEVNSIDMQPNHTRSIIFGIENVSGNGIEWEKKKKRIDWSVLKASSWWA